MALVYGIAPPRPAAGGGGFSVPTERAGGAAAAVPTAEVSLGGMLALQEAEGGAVRDRAARRHGQQMLVELARLQRALLDGRVDAGALEQLASLAESVPLAADAGLRATMAEVALRARIELARHRPVTTA